MIHYLNCRHTARLLSDRLERSLSCFEWICLGVHLLGCEPCSRFGRVIRWLHRFMSQAPCDAQLSPEVRERIRLALEQAAKDE